MAKGDVGGCQGQDWIVMGRKLFRIKLISVQVRIARSLATRRNTGLVN